MTAKYTASEGKNGKLAKERDDAQSKVDLTSNAAEKIQALQTQNEDLTQKLSTAEASIAQLTAESVQEKGGTRRFADGVDLPQGPARHQPRPERQVRDHHHRTAQATRRRRAASGGTEVQRLDQRGRDALDPGERYPARRRHAPTQGPGPPDAGARPPQRRTQAVGCPVRHAEQAGRGAGTPDDATHRSGARLVQRPAGDDLGFRQKPGVRGGGHLRGQGACARRVTHGQPGR